MKPSSEMKLDCSVKLTSENIMNSKQNEILVENRKFRKRTRTGVNIKDTSSKKRRT